MSMQPKRFQRLWANAPEADDLVKRCALEFYRQFQSGPFTPTASSIADAIPCNRNRVRALIDEAYRRGLLHLSIRLAEDDLLARQLESKWQLREAVIVHGADTAQNDQATIRSLLAPIALRYLTSYCRRLATTDPDRTIRIGVDGGQTLYEAVNTRDHAPIPNLHCEIVPLVFGPLIGSQYTAQNVARMLGEHLAANDEAVSIQEGFELVASLKKATKSRSMRTLSITVRDQRVIRNLDVLWVAIGSRTAGLRARELGRLRLSKKQETAHFGDVCNLAFDKDGNNITALDYDRAALITLDELQTMATTSSALVIAAAGGNDKVDAIEKVLEKQFINVLITDRGTASKLTKPSKGLTNQKA